MTKAKPGPAVDYAAHRRLVAAYESAFCAGRAEVWALARRLGYKHRDSLRKAYQHACRALARLEVPVDDIRDVLRASRAWVESAVAPLRAVAPAACAPGEALLARIDAALAAPTAKGGTEVPADPLVAYLERQWAWSKEMFGPALRTKGIVQHITKELREIEADPHDLAEWVDVIILAMDGFWRHGGKPSELLPAMQAKQDRNFARTWPDWRTMGEDQAIEHDRSGEASPPPPAGAAGGSAVWTDPASPEALAEVKADIANMRVYGYTAQDIAGIIEDRLERGLSPGANFPIEWWPVVAATMRAGLAGAAGGGSGDLEALSAGAKVGPKQIARALRETDWSGVSIGDKAILRLAIEALEAPTPDLGAQGEPVAWERKKRAADKATDIMEAISPRGPNSLSDERWNKGYELIEAALLEAPAATRTGSGVSAEEIARAWWDRVCPHSDRGRWEENKQRTDKLSKQLVAETYDDAHAILALIAQAPRDGGETQGEQMAGRIIRFLIASTSSADREEDEDLTPLRDWGRDRYDVLRRDLNSFEAARRQSLAEAVTILIDAYPALPTPPSGVETIRQDNTRGGL